MGIQKITIRKLWILQNKNIHDLDPTGKTSFQKKNILEEIQQMYDQREELKPRDRQVLPPGFCNKAKIKNNALLHLFIKVNKQII